MVEIIFQNKEDARKLHQYLERQLQKSELLEKSILRFEDQHIGKIKINFESNESRKLVKKAFYQFLIEIKQTEWFHKILKDHYYYDDEDEAQQIVEIIQSVLEGERIELTAFMEDLDHTYLMESIDQMFTDHVSFSFDSFVRFRLRPFIDQLEKYVEVAIDEYKMEQEYQMFIQMLRDFLVDRPAKINDLHLLMEGDATFYDEEFFEIKRVELIGMIDRKLLSNHPVYVDSVTIAPLLSIAPDKIYLYTDDAENPLVRTIRNIFEERVILHSTSQFFEHQKMFSFPKEEKI